MPLSPFWMPLNVEPVMIFFLLLLAVGVIFLMDHSLPYTDWSLLQRSPMAVSLQGYIRDFMQTFVFFSSNVQTTTIAIAITGSICCSIIWFIINVISAAVSDGQRTLSSPRLCAGSHRLKHSMFLPCQPPVHAHVSKLKQIHWSLL